MDAVRPSAPSALLVVLCLVAGACAGDSETAEPASTTEPAITATTIPPADPSTTAGSTVAATTLPAVQPTQPTSTIEDTTTSTPSSTAMVACGQPPVGVTEFDLTAGGADHPVRVFVPSSFAGERLPTVLNWHGLGGDGPQQAAVTRYEELAEAEGFVVVHPTGVPAPGDTRNSWQLAPSSGADDRDDVAFANALIDEMIATWCTDVDRVYSTGMSNGGFFTARLVCTIADRLAAASSVAGLYHTDDCMPSRTVPYIAFHGTDDRVVPFDGDGESVLLGADSDPALRVFFEQVMPDEFAEFAEDAGCQLAPTAVTLGDVTRYDYSGCSGDTPMAFFEVAGGGHTWPNWPIAAAVEAVFGYTTTAVDATVDSWEFFEQHSLDG